MEWAQYDFLLPDGRTASVQATSEEQAREVVGNAHGYYDAPLIRSSAYAPEDIPAGADTAPAIRAAREAQAIAAAAAGAPSTATASGPNPTMILALAAAAYYFLVRK